MSFLSGRALTRFWTRYGICLVLFFAFMVGFYHLGSRTWHGDELGSLGDAQNLHYNLQSLPYFVFLRFWSTGGTSEFWLRSPSAFFAVIMVAVSFAAVREAWGTRTALITGALLATAPFVVVYAQQVRYYTLFLLAATVQFYAFILYRRLRTRRRLAVLGLATLFLLTTQAMAFLLVLVEVIVLFFLLSPFSRAQKAALLGAGMVVAVVLLESPIRALGFNALAAFTDASDTFAGSRGLSISQVFKIPLTFFFFAFGESVYPLKYILVIPGLAFFGLALPLGLWRMRGQRMLQAFIVGVGALSLVLLFLVFDALIPPSFAGAAPRYLIFLLPLFYLVAAMGVQGRRSQLLLVPLLLVNLGSLASFWSGDWSYTDDLIDWRAVTEWTDKYVTPQTALLLDGRAEGVADYYFPPTWSRQSEWTYQTTGGMETIKSDLRIIVFSDDFHLEARQQASVILQEIEGQFDRTAVWSHYPLFVYVYDRRQDHQDTVYQVDPTTGSSALPSEIYGLEFQDLQLPATVTLGSRRLQLLGEFELPAPDQSTRRDLPLARPTTASRIWLLSNLTDAAGLKPGTVLGRLTAKGEDGSTKEFPLRAGLETAAWNDRCQPAACTSVYTWRKRLALLGAEGYPGSSEEFDASIFAVELDLNSPILIRALEIQRVASPGTLHVWGIVLQE